MSDIRAIQVTLPYRGIDRGVYAITDKRVADWWDYLLRHGHAVVVELPEGIEIATPPPEPEPAEKPKRTYRKRGVSSDD